MNLQQHVPLAPYTTFGIGGPARWFVEVHTEAEIVEAAAFAKDQRVPIFALGGGSNLLVSDTGYPGLVIRVALMGVEQEACAAGTRLFRAGAGEDWDELVSHTVAAGCGGMECLAGIPGMVGGTPVQNVGAYGQEVAQTVVRVRGYDLTRNAFEEWDREECEFTYRSSRFNTRDRGRYLLTRVDYALTPGATPCLEYADLKRYFKDAIVDPTIEEASLAVRLIRKEKGMLLSAEDPDSRSAGSFFKNPIVGANVHRQLAAAFDPLPVPHYPAPAGSSGEPRVKIPAAWLLEKAGFHRGYVRGEAGLSSRHTLALINRGKARAEDILALSEEIQAVVRARFGIQLEREPVWLG